ncbi:MAG: ChbG/HpnK family deacetylase [Acidobacteriota bacterium]
MAKHSTHVEQPAKRRIVCIADDLGMSERINQAILHAHRHGVLLGAGLMMGQAGTEGAVELARQNPSLQVGWHLHLSNSRPCTLPAWPWGDSLARAGFTIGLTRRGRRLARREIEQQWQAFQATGLKCRFINAHHHLHVHPFVRRTLLATLQASRRANLRDTLPPGFEGWIRWGRPRFFERGVHERLFSLLDFFIQARHRGRLGYEESATLWGIDRTFAMQANEVVDILPTLGDGLHELMFHPRRLQDDPDTQCLLDLAELAPDAFVRA